MVSAFAPRDMKKKTLFAELVYDGIYFGPWASLATLPLEGGKGNAL